MVKELGLTSVNWHTLRHTFARRLAMAGVTEATIANLLGHSGTSLVRRYAHLSPSYLQEAVKKVSTFGKAKPTSQETRRGGAMESKEVAESSTSVSTVQKNRKIRRGG
jgi:hypothetical protein